MTDDDVTKKREGRETIMEINQETINVTHLSRKN